MVSITATPVYCVPGTLSHYCGAYSWGPQWSSRRVEFWYDNEMVAAVLTLAPLEILTLMVPMHFLALLAVCHSFPFKASSVHAKANPVADTLSRFQFQRFRHLALQAENADPSPPPPPPPSPDLLTVLPVAWQISAISSSPRACPVYASGVLVRTTSLRLFLPSRWLTWSWWCPSPSR